MVHRAEKLKQDLLTQVFQLALTKAQATEQQEVKDFIQRFYANVSPDDLLAETPENLLGAALSLWHWGASRDPEQIKIRLYTPKQQENGWSSTHSIIEIVNDDMSFLVDSVVKALHQLDLPAYLVIHPVIQIKRIEGKRQKTGQGHAESFMQIRISEQTSPERILLIQERLLNVLKDVKRAVSDWSVMRQHNSQLQKSLGLLNIPESLEYQQFLKWLDEDHFTYLGMAEYDFTGPLSPMMNQSKMVQGYGLFKNPDFKLYTDPGFHHHLPPEVTQLSNKKIAVLTKAGFFSTVHRHALMDVVIIAKVTNQGTLGGCYIFVGLLTARAYNTSLKDIPVLRHKLQRLTERAAFPVPSHNAKSFRHILETYPRDELFQADENHVFETVLSILRLQERQRVALFMRRDLFKRFYCAIVCLPRDRYDGDLRRQIEDNLLQAFQGQLVVTNTYMGDDPLGRLYLMIRTDPTNQAIVDVEELERRLVEIGRSWKSRLKETLVENFGGEKAASVIRRFVDAFPLSYREHFSPQTASTDIIFIDKALSADQVVLYLYVLEDSAESGYLGLKIYSPSQQISLSDALPVLENMGLRVLSEMFYAIELYQAQTKLWIHDFRMKPAQQQLSDIRQLQTNFQECYIKVWNREIENDGFNALVLQAGLDWRQVSMLRAYAKYLRQAAIPFSQQYMEETLSANPVITVKLVELFQSMFDPAAGNDEQKSQVLKQEIDKLLESVSNLDQDRIIRRYLNVILSTLRTNFYQRGSDQYWKNYLSFKINSRLIEDLPLPCPMVEIFVYSPRVEGIHLRGGKVARGGIRWSDRREDFRTEILGLLKAQMVKNSVIVPVGSKGGFVLKNPPATGREAMQQEGIECYKIFISGLLDITDNLSENRVVPPKDVVRRDDDDPYLVVAADKGTATFSDTANKISRQYGFWLDDAFASGGSAGYDHKKMGITAKGVWETVKRHFREIGRDIQKQDFTCVGVGDMSGDVFGNGMLLSKHTRLLGAFNHVHIFIDPNPDPTASWQERKRLFDLPRSAWTDYNTQLISSGGGVFDRKAKSIKLSAEARECFGIKKEAVTPNELIRHLLQSQVDLLFFGGIGTYVKSTTENHAEVGDRTNDQLRVDGASLRCRVVGEGANLGLTQRGRIEFAMKGGRINTDALDNSAGVDCSDHEVNIKILLNGIVAKGKLSIDKRNVLLSQMTDEVSQLVLRDNYLQSQALSIAEHTGWVQLDQQVRFMRALEKQGKLDRALEFLPDDESVRQRQNAQIGLTRPELAILLAYAKMTLYDELLPSSLPDDQQLIDDLYLYFPKPLQQAYQHDISQHRLRREIIATAVTNSLVNRVGPSFLHVMKERTGKTASDITRAYAITRSTFNLRQLWSGIEELDNKVKADIQLQLFVIINRMAEAATLWFLKNGQPSLNIAEHFQAFSPGINLVAQNLSALLGDLDRKNWHDNAKQVIEQGTPENLARAVYALEFLEAGLDIVRIAQNLKADVLEVAAVYFKVGDRLQFDWLRDAAMRANKQTHWDRMALAAILEELDMQQNALSISILQNKSKSKATAEFLIEEWGKQHQTAWEDTQNLLSDLRKAPNIDLAKLVIVSQQLKLLLA
jgi:glutamate dehydrogenase